MKKSLIMLLLLLTACSIAPGAVVNIDKIDFNKFEVIELKGEGVCRGTVENPCIALAVFSVREIITANPVQLIEFDMPVKEIRTYSKELTFEPGHNYTLKYEVLKNNPEDTVKWKFAGRE